MDILKPLNTESKTNELIELFRQLDSKGQNEAIKLVGFLLKSGDYTKKPPLPIPWATKRN